jgi:hypothetical protein
MSFSCTMRVAWLGLDEVAGPNHSFGRLTTPLQGSRANCLPTYCAFVSLRQGEDGEAG